MNYIEPFSVTLITRMGNLRFEILLNDKDKTQEFKMFKSITRAQLKNIFIRYGSACINDHLNSRGVKINLRKSEVL